MNQHNRNRNDRSGQNRGDHNRGRHDHNRDRQGRDDRGPGSKPPVRQQTSPVQGKILSSSDRVWPMFSSDMIDVPTFGHGVTRYKLGGIMAEDRRQVVGDSAQEAMRLAQSIKDRQTSATSLAKFAALKQKVEKVGEAAKYDPRCQPNFEEAQHELANAEAEQKKSLGEAQKKLDEAMHDFRETVVRNHAAVIVKSSETYDGIDFRFEFRQPIGKRPVEFLFLERLSLGKAYETIDLGEVQTAPKVSCLESTSGSESFFRMYLQPERQLGLVALASPDPNFWVDEQFLFAHGKDQMAILKIRIRNKIEHELGRLRIAEVVGNFGESQELAAKSAAKVASKSEPQGSVEGTPEEKTEVEAKTVPAPKAERADKPVSRPKPRRITPHDDSDKPVGTSLAEKLQAAGVKVSEPPKPEPTVEKVEESVRGGQGKKAAKKKPAKKKAAGDKKSAE